MPQIAQIGATYASQIFWLLLTFGLIFVTVGMVMLPKVQSTVDARDKQIADDLSAADRARQDADAKEEAYRAKEEANRAEALKVTLGAKADAAKESEATLAKADAEIAGTVSAAETRIAAAKQKAMTEVESVATDATQDIVTRLSGAKTTPAQVATAVKAALGNV